MPPLAFPNLQVFLVDQFKTAYPDVLANEFPDAPPAPPEAPSFVRDSGLEAPVTKEEIKEIKSKK